MKKLSIIMPVYNVEEYIRECMESLTKQTLKDMEILVVDDGSTDGSIDIVKSFRDDRIKILRKKNGGLSSARNYGLKYANGEMVAFIDSDDFISIPEAFEDMCNIAEKTNSDIVVGNSAWYYSNDNIISYQRNKEIFREGTVLTGQEHLLVFMRDRSMLRTVWTNIYRRKFLLENELYFKEGILHEDELFTPITFIKAKRVSIYEKSFYMYRQREGSIMNSGVNMKRANDMLYVAKTLNEEFKKLDNKELKFILDKHVNHLILSTLCTYKIVNPDKELIDIVLNNTKTRKDKIYNNILRISPRAFINLRNFKRGLRRKLKGN